MLHAVLSGCSLLYLHPPSQALLCLSCRNSTGFCNHSSSEML